jgi:hypothetical protein
VSTVIGLARGTILPCQHHLESKTNSLRNDSRKCGYFGSSQGRM